MSGSNWRDQLLDHVQATIEVHGFVIQYVLGEGADPPWAYTIGFLAQGHPEVLVFGLDEVSTCGALHALFDEIVAGIIRPVGRDHVQPLGTGPPVRLLPAPEEHWSWNGNRLCTAVDYYATRGWDREALSAVQLVWATPTGDFPWEAECSARFRHLQPILDPGSRAAA